MAGLKAMGAPICPRLNPRGVPPVNWLLFGKWPLLLASDREGAM
jgi:hypothetical protein